MTPQERARLEAELELIEIELELARRKAQQDQQAPALQAPAQRGFLRGMWEVAKGIPQHARETGAAMLVGPAKAVTGLFDLATLPFAERHGLKPVTPKVDALRDRLAGRRLGNELPTALAEAAFGGPYAMLGAGVANRLEAAGAGPWAALAGGIAAPLAAKSVVNYARTGLSPSVRLARGRIEHALSGVDPKALQEAIHTQDAARRQGVFILPSQGTARPMPGLDRLETEALLSHAWNAKKLRALVSQQPDMANQLVTKLIGQVGKPGSVRDAAEGLHKAAVARLRADRERQIAAVKPLFDQAEANKTPVSVEDIKARIKFIKGRIEDLKGNKEFADGARDLIRRLEDLIRPPKKDVPPQPTAPQLYRVLQSFQQTIDKVDPRGVPYYSDHVAKELRLTAESAVRELLEEAEPIYQFARKTLADMRAEDARGVFDQLTKISKANTPESVLGEVLKDSQAVREIAPSSFVTPGDGHKAASKALATALEMVRQKEFSPGRTGQINPGAGAAFVSEIAGTPTKKENLLASIKALGGDPDKADELIELAMAVSRPTVVHGARLPVTDFSPAVEGTRMIIGHDLAQKAARMRFVQAFINRLSDKAVIDILSRPDSARILASLPQAHKLTPRQKVFIVLTAAGQAAPGKWPVEVGLEGPIE